MSRLLTLVALAAMIWIGHGESTASNAVTTSMVATTSIVATTSSSMTATSSMQASTSTPTPPKPTPTPSPAPKPTDNTYFLNNTGKVCLRLQSGFAIKFNYSAKDNAEGYQLVDFTSKTAVIHPDSYCNVTNEMAELKLEFTFKETKFYLALLFKGFDKKTWNVTEMTISFIYNEADFPNYDGPSLSGLQTVTSNSPLIDNDVGFNQSFTCVANRTIKFPSVEDALGVRLFVDKLQAQAFDFTKPQTGAFDSTVGCLEDNTGNKVVPIAVGAALAGLVIVVLIAYLIGRLRNRRKSSYEALS